MRMFIVSLVLIFCVASSYGKTRDNKGVVVEDTDNEIVMDENGYERGNERAVNIEESAATVPNLAGYWTATYNAGCGSPAYVEVVKIEQKVNKFIVAFKTVGNGCVPAGWETFHGHLITQVINGKAHSPSCFQVLGYETTGGVVTERSGPCTPIEILDATHFKAIGLKFTKVP